MGLTCSGINDTLNTTLRGGHPRPVKNLFPRSFYNIVSLIGGAISAIALLLIVFLFVVDVFARQSSPYLGLITFLVLPMFLVLGVMVMVVGIVREHRRVRAGKKPSAVRLSNIDLNDAKHRNAFFLVLGGSILFLGSLGFASYQAYEYTDSTSFCGRICHKVMKPEYVAYQSSPHARVVCAQCHIGPGATWFVRSKLSGMYQVYATMFNKYPRPISTPIHNLRPARETCEQCHWPRYFASEKLRVYNYFLSDEHNTPGRVDLLMKIGGGSTDQGPSYGIHWHMNIANTVTYAALDRERELIPWVRVKSKDGTTRVYRSTEIAASDEQIQKAEKRRMDCIDCHNRPTHVFNPPATSVNMALSQNRISPDLPRIKSAAMEALGAPYKSQREANDGIRRSIEGFYQSQYPSLLVDKGPLIQQAIKQVQGIYVRNYFPEMRANWKAFQNNLGHLYYPGCFRCHDGKHVSADGKVLSRDCQSCHTILAQQVGSGKTRTALGGVEFHHPAEIGNAWKETNCSNCHNEK
jgi:hypothetical protein